MTLFAIEIPVANISPDDGRSDRFWESLREKAIYEQLSRSVSKYEDVPEALSRILPRLVKVEGGAKGSDTFLFLSDVVRHGRFFALIRQMRPCPLCLLRLIPRIRLSSLALITNLG